MKLVLPKFLQPLPIAWGGLDVSLRGISSFVMITPDDKSLRVACHFWMPRESWSLPQCKDVPIHQNLSLTPGNIVDYEQIAADVEAKKQHFKIQMVAYDQRGSWEAVRAIDKRRIKVVSYGQGFTSMTRAIREWKRLVELGMRSDDPILNWMIGNLAMREDAAGNVAPDRSKAKAECGGAIALFMAIGLWTSRI